jgi:hypothetical protein
VHRNRYTDVPKHDSCMRDGVVIDLKRFCGYGMLLLSWTSYCAKIQMVATAELPTVSKFK